MGNLFFARDGIMALDLAVMLLGLPCVARISDRPLLAGYTCKAGGPGELIHAAILAVALLPGRFCTTI